MMADAVLRKRGERSGCHRMRRWKVFAQCQSCHPIGILQHPGKFGEQLVADGCQLVFPLR